MSSLPSNARVVIIGGGISGCSVAYHLAKLGWKDIVLLERKQLTSGTTWHAAGLVGQLRASQNMTRLAKYSADLYTKLETETGLATGFRQCGSITAALTTERKEEILRQASLARAFGVEVNELSPAEVKQLYPHLNIDGVTAGVHLPLDGQADPGNIALALAKGARSHGAQIAEQVKVTAVTKAKGRVTGVNWQQGDETGHIAADMVVNCGGMWGRDLAAQSGVTLPLHACEHFYIVTEGIPGLTQMPVLRVPDECAYYKEDAGKILLGAFEPVAKPWGMDGIPEDFAFQLLPDDWDQFQILMDNALIRVPSLEKTGIKTFMNGPESFTPDNNFIMGEPPGSPGLFVLAGFNSIGIAAAGGVGRWAAEWLDAGEPTADLWSVDIRRFLPCHNRREFLRTRVEEVLGLHYQMAWPNREYETGRGLRRTPLHDRVAARGAVFGQVAGWERANWFATAGVPSLVEYSFARQNWATCVADEVSACRQRAAIFDQSTFAKFCIRGRDAAAVLSRSCANAIDGPPGRVVYTGLLNDRGTFESDLTVIRRGADEFLVVSGTAQAVRDADWLRRGIPAAADVSLEDVTEATAVIGLMGPAARAIAAAASDADLSHEAFPFATAREIDIAGCRLLAVRITYVGELGWELHVPSAEAAAVYDALVAAGAAHGLRPAGHYAIAAMRLEKGFRAWGVDLSSDDTPLEAGLGFAIDWSKDFRGRAALMAQREAGLRKRLVSFVLAEPGPTLWGNEPIYRDGALVGYTTSAAYGPTLGAAVALGYVRHPEGGLVTPEFIRAGGYEIENDGCRLQARVSLAAPYDPDRKRILC